LLRFLQSRFAAEQMEETVVGLTLQHCGLRWQASEPWLEGRPLPTDAVVASNASMLGNDLGLIEAAIGALRAWPRADARARAPSD
jgi:hypothetical protein